MNPQRKRMYFIIGGAVALLLVIAIVLVLILGGSGRKYARCYQEAQTAYLTRDYDTALDKLAKALEYKETREAYLLLADTYYAQGDTERAIQILYLGYSHVGGEELSDMLRRLGADSDGPNASPAPEDGVIIGGQAFDADTDSVVLNGSRVTSRELSTLGTMTQLVNLSLTGAGLTDVSELSNLTHLTFLQLSDNEIRDLAPLSGMRRLKTLYIDNNPLEDLTPLYGLSSLRTLSMKGIVVTQPQLQKLQEALPDCRIYTDTPTEEIVELTLGGKTFNSDVTELNLGGLGLKDISVLSRCTHLTKLDLRDNRIEDISPLLELPELEWLCLWNNEVEDIYPLLSLTRLEYLDLDGNEVEDVSALAYLINLEELWLNGNPLKSAEPLRALTKLRRLGLQGTDLSDKDLAMIADFSDLVELNIKGNDRLSAGAFDELQEALPRCVIAHDDLLYSVTLGGKQYFSDETEISAAGLNLTELDDDLEQFKKLQILRLPNNALRDLGPLKGLTSLTELWLLGNSISDLRPLAGLAKLTVLDLQDNQVQDLAPLADCVHLRRLLLSGNGLQSVIPLAACTELTELDLDNNALSEISALAALTDLKTLHLENNRITDLSALYSLTKLETLYLRGNDLRPDDILALQTMLPNCLIVHDVVMDAPAEPEAPELMEIPDE